MGLLLLLVWTYVTVYSIIGVVILANIACRWLWSLLPEPVNDLPPLTGRIWRLGKDRLEPL
jgi:hypothetical protein